ncbi:unnamed protein product [Microthlaspi erraticum]|uniref:Uncharacterized protein n=1 Tax=Microthlaspi erraticum TaxID=1685480 RepID=A0A6D2JXR3_9BRAS|nr:unnamed protein product [Microthlaspi erraticum]
MVSYVVQTLLFLIWRTLIFRRPVDSSHVRTMIVPPGQSCCIFTSARLDTGYHIHGEIVYPAVNHPPDTHCKEKRLGGSKMPLDRRRKRCENTIRAKTLAADAQKILAEQFSFWPTVTVEPGRNGVLGRITSRDRNRSAARTNREETAAIGRNFRIGRSIRETRSASAEISRPKQIWPTKSLDRDKIHRPSAQNFSRPRYPMAKTKGNESMKKKKNPFMEPPKKQIKLGSSSSNARAEYQLHHIPLMQVKNMWRVQEEEKMIGHL